VEKIQGKGALVLLHLEIVLVFGKILRHGDEFVPDVVPPVAGELLFRQPQGMQHCHILSPGLRGLNSWSLISRVFAPDNIFGGDRRVLVLEDHSRQPRVVRSETTRILFGASGPPCFQVNRSWIRSRGPARQPRIFSRSLLLEYRCIRRLRRIKPRSFFR